MLGGMYGIDLDVSMLILDICIIIYIYILVQLVYTTILL